MHREGGVAIVFFRSRNFVQKGKVKASANAVPSNVKVASEGSILVVENLLRKK